MRFAEIEIIHRVLKTSRHPTLKLRVGSLSLWSALLLVIAWVIGFGYCLVKSIQDAI